jgi:hypothetical protein
MLVDMERSYITAGFFRYTMSRRFEASQSQAAVQKALNKVCSCQHQHSQQLFAKWPKQCMAPGSSHQPS